jgi:hypothetical protein
VPELAEAKLLVRIAGGLYAATGAASAEPMSDAPGMVARSSPPLSPPVSVEEERKKLEAKDTGDSPSGARRGHTNKHSADNGVLCLEPSGPKPPGPHKTVIDAIHRMFVDRYGSKPTWDKKTTAIVARLLKLHPPEEIIRRAEIMFFEPRRFPLGPYDVGSLSVHFDKFAASTPSSGPVDRDRRKTGSTYYGDVTDV